MTNILPAQSSEFETPGNTGDWDPWFGCTLSQSTAEANQGTGSMAVNATGSFVGVQPGNFPGWAAAPGTYTVSYAAKRTPGGPNPSMDLVISWRTGSTEIGTDILPLSIPNDVFGTAQKQSVAPAGTDTVWVTLEWDGSATSGETYFIDSIVLDDGVGGAVTDLTVAEASHSHIADSPTLTQTHALTANEATHAQAADAVALTQVHNLVVEDATHTHTADSPTLSATSTTNLVVDDAPHSHAADQVALTQTHQLVVHDASHGHTAGSPAVNTATTLTVADTQHTHVADSPALTQVHVLTIDDGVHEHLAEHPSLTQLHQLITADALHAHTADQVVLILGEIQPPPDVLTLEAIVDTNTLTPIGNARTLTVIPDQHTLTAIEEDE